MPRSGEASKARQKKKASSAAEVRRGRNRRVTELLEQIETKLKVEDMKITLGDFIRLMQLERELEQDEPPREIIITWKDPSERPVG
jgi:hypothetical protein